MGRVRESAQGFTLVETLVSIAIVAVLLGILLPAMKGVREKSWDMHDLSNLRQTTQQFQMWSDAHDGIFLNGGGDKPPYTVIVRDGMGATIGAFDYFDHAGSWSLVLRAFFGEEYATWTPQHSMSTAYLYGMGMVTDPRLWEGCAFNTQLRWRYARRVRMTETSFPSNKGLLVEAHREKPITPDTKYPMSFVDGSAAVLQKKETREGVLETACAGTEPVSVAPVVWTEHGILGRDK